MHIFSPALCWIEWDCVPLFPAICWIEWNWVPFLIWQLVMQSVLYCATYNYIHLCSSQRTQLEYWTILVTGPRRWLKNDRLSKSYKDRNSQFLNACNYILLFAYVTVYGKRDHVPQKWIFSYGLRQRFTKNFG